MLILDTNIVSQLMRVPVVVFEQYDAAIDRGEVLAISAVTFYELQRGLLDPRFTRKRSVLEALLDNLELVIPDFHTYKIAAEIWWDLKQVGAMLEDNDILIAATAISFGETLVTDNTKHFERIKGLKLENWIERS